MIDGVSVRNGDAIFHEFVIQLDSGKDGHAEQVLEDMAEQGVLAGYNIETHYESLKNCILVCVTEVKNSADLDLFVAALNRALEGGES